MSAWSRIMFESMVEPQRPVPTINTGWIVLSTRAISSQVGLRLLLRCRRYACGKQVGGATQNAGIPADVFGDRCRVHLVALLRNPDTQSPVAVLALEQARTPEVRLVKTHTLFHLMLDPIHL